MKYVLHTNVLSALLKGERNAVDRLKSMDRSQVSIPQPVIAEIEHGIARLYQKKRKTLLKERWKLFLNELNTVPWTDEVSAQFGTVKAFLERRGMEIEDFDAAVAAHALANDAVLVTSDRSHMRRIKKLKTEQW